jgi:Rieske 2Fe-2S family protein
MPALERTLPRRAYFDEDVYQREREGIFSREWCCAGREESVPTAGDYAIVTVAGESVLLVRGGDGVLRGFFNVCRHRGCELVLTADLPPLGDRAGPSGHFASAIRCPYHSWTYALDGALRTAPFLEDDARFSRSDLPLHPVGIGVWGGFVFVNLTPARAAAEGRTLAAQLGDAPARVARYPLAALRTAHRIVYDVAANWKVMLENYNECYHCAGVHPELCALVPAFKFRGGSELDWASGIPHRPGAWTFTETGTSTRAPFAGLDASEQVRHKGELLYPNLMLSLSADHVAAFTLWPQGPTRTTIACDFLFDPAEIAKPGFDPSDAVNFWDLVNRQDWAICEGVQRGMRSRMFEHGYYAPMESWSLDIRRYVRDRIGDLDA